jgi:hypothetical protein
LASSSVQQPEPWWGLRPVPGPSFVRGLVLPLGPRLVVSPERRPARMGSRKLYETLPTVADRRCTFRVESGHWCRQNRAESRGLPCTLHWRETASKSVRPSTTVKTASHTDRTYREEPDRQTRRESGSQRRRSLPGTVRPHSMSSHRSHKQDIVAQTSKSLNRSL